MWMVTVKMIVWVRLASVCDHQSLCGFQAYLWDSNQVVVEWLEKQLAEDDGMRSAIRENIKYLKRDYALKHIRRSGVMGRW